MFVIQARAYHSESTFQMLHSGVGSCPYPQTLVAGKACQGQTPELITNIHKLRTKSSIILAPGFNVVKYVTAEIYECLQ